MTEHTPPRWADKFLRWYCNPDLLEEIQGDAHELYHFRVSTEGKSRADRKYIFDVIRFFRWSNIKRSENSFTPNSFAIFWNLNLKIAFRNAVSHKVRLATKIFSLAICLVFGLILSAFILQEFSFDMFHSNHDRIFRIGSEVTLDGVVTNYAISPIALGDALPEEIPDVEQTCTLFHGGKPVFTVDDKIFYEEKAFLADADFLKMFSFKFLKGTAGALDEPGRIVLTETTARKFFGDTDPIGQTINMAWAELEVSGVLEDVPANSHLKFDVLVSWGTYRIDESWANLNGYTYMLLKEGAHIGDVSPKIIASFDAHRVDIEADRDYVEGTRVHIAPIIENITQIHLAPALDEDVAIKRSKNNVWILSGIVCLFFLTGLINYFNISLAEITTGAKKTAVLRIFGGADANEGKVVATNIIMTLIFLVPISLTVFGLGVIAPERYFGIYIETNIFTSIEFFVLLGGFVCVLIVLSKINYSILRKSSDLIDSLKGKINKRFSGFKVREMLVSLQLSFSIAMIAMIVIIVNQFDFINALDKGFEDKNTIVIPMRTDDFDAANSFQTAVNELAGVVKADGSSFYLENIEKKEFFEIETSNGNKKMLVSYLNCGYSYLDLLGVQVLLGRNFSKDFAADERGAYVINEVAAKEFGWKNPVGQRISGPYSSDREEGEVIGVVKDFHFASLHKRIEPLIIFLVSPDWGVRYTYVKLEPLRSKTAMIGKIESVYKKHIGADVPFEWEYLDSKFASLYKEDAEIRDLSKIGMIISIFVSCLGIFTLSSLILVMRAKEMSIRKVVGASRGEVLVLHLKSFGKFLFVSAAIAWIIIYLVSENWLNNFAYHIDVTIWNFILPTVSVSVIVILISAYHGFKSSMANAVDVLKHE